MSQIIMETGETTIPDHHLPDLEQCCQHVSSHPEQKLDSHLTLTFANIANNENENKEVCFKYYFTSTKIDLL